MNVDTLLRYIVPIDQQFFPHFRIYAANLVNISELLVEQLNNPDSSLNKEKLQRLMLLSENGNSLSRSLMSMLDVTFITPMERTDICLLINSLKGVQNHLISVAKRVSLYKIKEVPVEFVQIAELVHAAVQQIHLVFENVNQSKDFLAFAAEIHKIDELESAVDEIYNEFLSRLFEEEEDAFELIKKRDVITRLEKAINKCDFIAKIFMSQVIKMG